MSEVFFLLGVLWMLTPSAGCIVPPHLEQESDAGMNHRPSIITLLTSPPIGPMTWYQSSSGSPLPLSKGFNVAVRDLDRQVIHVRMFLGGKYNQKLPLSSDRTQGGSVDQAAIFEVSGLCDNLVDNKIGRHVLELYVSDSGFSDTGTDLRVPVQGGQTDNIFWDLNCIASVGDGGL